MSLKGFLTKTLAFTFLFGFLVASPAIIPAGISSSNEAYATTSQEDREQQTALVIVLCNALNFFTGTLGRTFAALVIIAIGIGFFSGKISWGTVIAASLGIAVIFGSPTIINLLTGESNNPCVGVGTQWDVVAE